MGAGIQFEGAEPPEMGDGDRVANQIFNALANGSGGLDWQGLEFMAAYFGAHDIEALVHRLLIIKGHRPDKN
mgnify:CR=1 FL=1